MSTKNKKMEFTLQVNEAMKQLTREQLRHARIKRRTKQVRVEQGRFERLRGEAEASKRTISKTMDRLIDAYLRPEKARKNRSKML